MAAGGDAGFLGAAAVYLGAAVIAVPLFRQLKLGSVLGYLTAGVLIGPQVLTPLLGLGLDPKAAEKAAEFGVVLLLFVIGLELRPATFWRLRYEVFGLGAAQVALSGLLIGVIGYSTVLFSTGLGFGLSWREAVVAGAGLALSSTAFAVQILREKGDLGTPYGQRAFAVLLFQDLAIVPLIAMVSLMAPAETAGDPVWWATMKALAAVGAVYFAGRYALKPVFSVIAQAHADEVFTAAALLVVVGAALAMHAAGLSMALGAFLAGLLLAESPYRHQLETAIEPFRGLLMGLFFIAVGMGLDLNVFGEFLFVILGSVIALILVKIGVLYGLARMMGSSRIESLRIAVVLSQGGEFAFVLFQEASGGLNGMMDVGNVAVLKAVVTLSMALTPFLVAFAARFERKLRAPDEADEDGLDGLKVLEEAPEEARESHIIVAGFGRAGQVVARILRLRGYEVTLIDNSPRRIRMAETFGSEVFYGDARRLDTLATAGADQARAIFLCINDRDGARLAVERIRTRFPNLRIYATTYDRFSMLEMDKAGAHVVERENFESAIILARRALADFGEEAVIDDLVEEFRRSDEKLLKYQARFGAYEGIRKLREGYSLEKEQ